MKIADRVAKLEAVKGSRSYLRLVQRHIIIQPTEAERRARIRDVLADATGNVLHVFRVVTDPAETTVRA